MLIKQLLGGDTIYERIQALGALKNMIETAHGSFSGDMDIINALQNSILRDDFYAVSVEAAKITRQR